MSALLFFQENFKGTNVRYDLNDEDVTSCDCDCYGNCDGCDCQGGCLPGDL